MSTGTKNNSAVMNRKRNMSATIGAAACVAEKTCKKALFTLPPSVKQEPKEDDDRAQSPPSVPVPVPVASSSSAAAKLLELVREKNDAERKKHEAACEQTARKMISFMKAHHVDEIYHNITVSDARQIVPFFEKEGFVVAMRVDYGAVKSYDITAQNTHGASKDVFDAVHGRDAYIVEKNAAEIIKEMTDELVLTKKLNFFLPAAVVERLVAEGFSLEEHLNTTTNAGGGTCCCYLYPFRQDGCDFRFRASTTISIKQ